MAKTKKQNEVENGEGVGLTITNVMGIEPALARCKSCDRTVLCYSYPEEETPELVGASRISFDYYCLKCSPKESYAVP